MPGRGLRVLGLGVAVRPACRGVRNRGFIGVAPFIVRASSSVLGGRPLRVELALR